MSKTLKQQWIELTKIRIWITGQLPGETDKQVRDSLFEARQAIGSALLHLERVNYRTEAHLDSGDRPLVVATI